MNDLELEEMRRKFGGAGTSPPEDLLDRLKQDIPSGEKLRRTTPRGGAGMSDHPAAWRLAASIVMLFGFAYVGARIYFESRGETYASPSAFVMMKAKSASSDSAPAVTASESESDVAEQAARPQSAPPSQMADATRRNDSRESRGLEPRAALERFSPVVTDKAASLPERQPKKELSEPIGVTESEDRPMSVATAAPPPPPPSAARAVSQAPAAPAPQIAKSAPAEARDEISSRSEITSAGASANSAVDLDASRNREEIYTPGEGISTPTLLHADRLRLTKREAKALTTPIRASLVVGRDGAVRDATLLSSVPRNLRSRVLATLNSRSYRPAMRDGQAVAVRIETVIDTIE